MLFGVNILWGLKNIVLDRGPDPPQRGGVEFDAAFAKLLWPLYFFVCYQFFQEACCKIYC